MIRLCMTRNEREREILPVSTVITKDNMPRVICNRNNRVILRIMTTYYIYKKLIEGKTTFDCKISI